MKNKQEQFNGLKDKAILFAWIIGLLLLICMLWIFTQPIQSFYLMRSVNNVLINSNDTRRLSESLSLKTERTNLLGYWYKMHNTTDIMFVFVVFQDGLLVPLGAIVSADGKVDEIIPLSAHATQVFDALPKSILQMYTVRIESAIVPLITEGDRQ
jgi:hypothetical protein